MEILYSLYNFFIGVFFTKIQNVANHYIISSVNHLRFRVNLEGIKMTVALLKIKQLAVTSYLSHRRLPFLRRYAMASASPASVFQKVQIHREDTVSHPYLIAASVPSIVYSTVRFCFIFSPFSGIRCLLGWKRKGAGDRCDPGVVGR